jgi:hypothetical protein
MNPSRALVRSFLLLAYGAALLALQTQARAVEGAEGITAVSTKASRNYVRVKLPDGTFKAEEYAFGDGGHYAGPFPDDTIDKMTFLDVAHVIAGPLAAQNYIPTRDPNNTKLLIMLYWGTTNVSPSPSTSPGYMLYQGASASSSSASSGAPSRGGSSTAAGNAPNSEADEALAMMDQENKLRDHLDFTNAEMLGYNQDGTISTDRGDAIRHSALRHFQKDLISEIEQNRYFVILMAYDFQVLKNQKKHRLLWDARFSIAQRSNDFGKALPAMATYASRYFGQDSNGLVRKPIPIGNVEIGEPTLIELQGSPKN